MKILSAKEMQLADKATMASQNITLSELMERSGQQIFNLLHERLQGVSIPVHIFCGLGNNGGVGLILAKLLVEHGYNTHTYIVNFSNQRSKEFLEHYDHLKSISKPWPTQLKSAEDLPQIGKEDMVIDAIFGIGLNRPIVPWVIELIAHINTARAFTLSIDLPSGLYSTKAPDDPKGVIYASVVITFQLPKLIFYLPETAQYIQELEIIDIGLDQNAIRDIKTSETLIGKQDVLPLYQPRQKFSHKGDYGHSLIIGGSYGKMGSVVFATQAALRIGTGLATAYIPECGYTTLQTAVPEAMVITTDEDDYLDRITYDLKPNAIGIGIGLGTHEKTQTAFKKWLSVQETPLVIDADAIHLLAQDKDMCSKIPKHSILTPHAKELERLIGTWKDDFEKLDLAKSFSKKYECILVLKGAHTITVSGDQLYVNTSGNPGMATAGSGDILTGVLTGLIAQGYPSLHAAVFGVYLHGSAGDVAVQKLGFQAVLASDIVHHIGEAFLTLFQRPPAAPAVENAP